MKAVEGTLADVREKTTAILTEAEQIINDDNTRSAFITITILAKVCNDSHAKTDGTIGIRGDSDLIAELLLNVFRSNDSFKRVIKKMLMMDILGNMIDPDDDCDHDCEHCEEHSTYVN